MNIQSILQQTNHRPWNLPQGKWKYYQEWNNAIFLHWKVDLNELRKRVPDELEIDIIDGHAWVSLVAFDMVNIRPRLLPPFPPISNFHEINIRTYVKLNNKSGVYFLSIEGAKKLSCFIARELSGLPYRFSSMSRQSGIYSSSNSEFSDQFSLKYQVGSEIIEKQNFELGLTERYALYQDHGNKIKAFEIHHVEWPLFQLQMNELKVDYSRFSSLITNKPDICHYSPGVQVLAWD